MCKDLPWFDPEAIAVECDWQEATDEPIAKLIWAAEREALEGNGRGLVWCATQPTERWRSRQGSR